MWSAGDISESKKYKDTQGFGPDLHLQYRGLALLDSVGDLKYGKKCKTGTLQAFLTLLDCCALCAY